MTPTDLEDRLRRNLAAEAARTQAGMLRPLTEPERATRRTLVPRGTRRWLAPAAAMVAVAAVVAGVTLAGSGLPGRPRGGATSHGAISAPQRFPRFYVTVSAPPHVRIVVHQSETGKVLNSELLPGAQGAGPIPSIAAAGNDRLFAIAATVHPRHAPAHVGLFMLTLGGNGRPETLTSLANDLVSPGDFVDGIALSPNGRQLALAVQIPERGFNPQGEVEVISDGHPTRTWRGGAGLPWDPAWLADGRKLGFLWWDHLAGTSRLFTARTRERLLNTAAPGNGLLANSKVIAAAPPGRFLESAELSADGRTLLGTWYRNVPVGHPRATAQVSLGLVPLAGHRGEAFQERNIPFNGAAQENAADSSCNVLSMAGPDHATLAQCPALEQVYYIGHGAWISLSRIHRQSPVVGAAW